MDLHANALQASFQALRICDETAVCVTPLPDPLPHLLRFSQVQRQEARDRHEREEREARRRAREAQIALQEQTAHKRR